MQDSTVVSSGAIAGAGRQIVNVGQSLTTRVVDDLTASGSPAVARAADDFALWLSTELMMLSGRLTALGDSATTVAESFEAEDATLASAAGSAALR